MPVDPSELSSWSRAKYYGANLFLRGIIGAVGLVPYRWRIPAMGKLVSTLAPLAGYDRRVRDNLKLTCPELPEADVARLCREVSDNAGRMIAEMYAGDTFRERAVKSKVSGPGLELLDQARKDGRPAILVTGHFGNYEAARAALFARGHNMGALYRRMANPYFNEHYVHAMEQNGTPMFEQGKRGMVEMVRYLKKGGIVAIVTDLHVFGGENIEFFGKPAVTSLVPSELALKFNAVVIPVYGVRQENGLDFEIVMNDEIPHTDPVTMTKAICDDLEKMIRKHMGQWFWIHRRWKEYHPIPKPEETAGKTGAAKT